MPSGSTPATPRPTCATASCCRATSSTSTATRSARCPPRFRRRSCGSCATNGVATLSRRGTPPTGGRPRHASGTSSDGWSVRRPDRSWWVTPPRCGCTRRCGPPRPCVPGRACSSPIPARSRRTCTSRTASRPRSAGGSSSPTPTRSPRSWIGWPTAASAWRRWPSRTSTTAPGSCGTCPGWSRRRTAPERSRSSTSATRRVPSPSGWTTPAWTSRSAARTSTSTAGPAPPPTCMWRRAIRRR